MNPQNENQNENEVNGGKNDAAGENIVENSTENSVEYSETAMAGGGGGYQGRKNRLRRNHRLCFFQQVKS